MTNEFLDMCDVCLKDIPNIPTKLPNGLIVESDPFEDNQDTEGNDLQDVTDCYNRGLDNEEE